jgi:hypothetical protein
MNISLTVASYTEIVCSSIQQMLLKDELFRKGINSGPESTTTSHATIQRLLDAVALIASSLTPEEVLPPTCFYKYDETLPSPVDSDNEEDSEKSSTEDIESNVNDSCIISFDSIVDVEYTTDSKFRVNRTAEILLEDDLIPLGWSRNADINSVLETQENSPSAVFVVHTSFGNETFESLSRIICVIPQQLLPQLQLVLSLKSFTLNDIAGSSKSTDVGKKRKHKSAGGNSLELQSQISRLLSLLAQCGAIVKL